MQSFQDLGILFLILITLATILIYLQNNEYFRDLIHPSPKNINTNNNSNNYQFSNKSPYKHFLKNPEKKYLGWDKWWKENKSKACVPKQQLSLPLQNYLNNTPLKYDGIWKKNINGDYYNWIKDVKIN